MEWLHTLLWVLGALAAASLLGAVYLYDVVGHTGAAGLLALLGLVLGGQVLRVRRWLRRMDRAKSE